MKLNTAERLMVNNPIRVFFQMQIVKWMKRAHPFNTGPRVLEIGCGRGAGVDLVTRYFRPSSLVAVDMDERMIRAAEHRFIQSHKNHVRLSVAEATALPFKGHSFDAVFAFGVLHHVPDWPRAASEIARVLDDGGYYYLEEYYPASYQNAITRHILKHPEENRFVGWDLIQELRRQGLRLVRRYEIKGLGVLAVLRRA